MASATPDPKSTPLQPTRAALWWRWWAVVWLLVAGYLLSRLAALDALPLFNDEVAAMVRAQQFLVQESIGMGKLLQEITLGGILLVGDSDSTHGVLLARLLSVACGLGTLLTLCWLGRLLNAPTAGWIAGGLYVLAPLALIHDTLALSDSMLALASALVLVHSLVFLRLPSPTRKDAVLMGLSITAASLVKLSGLFLVAFPLLGLVLLADSPQERTQRLRLAPSIIIGALLGVAALSPLHYGGRQQGKFGETDLLERLGAMLANIPTVLYWVGVYGPGLLLVGCLVWLLLNDDRANPQRRVICWLLAGSVVFGGAFVVLSQTLYPRYLLPAWPPLLLACSIWLAGSFQRPRGWRWWAMLCLLVAGYLLSRLAVLDALPLFNDEAIYLLRARTFPAELTNTLGDGKLIQELLLALLVRLPADPLLLARLLSVACGLGTVLLLLRVGVVLNNRAAGTLAALLYMGAPLALLHDTLALSDSMLTMMAVLVVWQSIWLLRQSQPSRTMGLLVGLLIGAASLVKLPGLFLAAYPMTALLFLSETWAERRERLRLMPSIIIGALLGVAALAPFHYGGKEQGKFGETDLLERLGAMLANIPTVLYWVGVYGPGLLLVGCLVWLLLNDDRANPQHRVICWLLAGSVVFGGAFVVLSQTLYPRYLLPAWPPLLLACSIWLAGSFQRPGGWRRLAGALLALTLLWNGSFLLQFVQNPLQAPLVATDRRQYLENWTAGHHLPQVMATVEAAAQEHGKALLVTHDQPRLNRYAARFFWHNHPTVATAVVDLSQSDAPERLRQLAATHGGPVYFLLDEQEYQAGQVAERFPFLETQQVFENPGGRMRFYLFRVPTPAGAGG